MIFRFALTLGALTSVAFSLGLRSTRADDVSFPHARHERLFPLGCGSCHAGITAGDSTTMFPAVASCADCHNRRDAKLSLIHI